MGLMQEIQEMDPKEVVSRPVVKTLWDKSLLRSFSRRRSYRNALGVDVPDDGFFHYRKKKEPIPLSAVELALLCWAAVGSNGLIRGDGRVACQAKEITWEGCVNTGAVYRWNYLLFNSDEGLFSYKRHVPTKAVEVETQEDMAVIFQAFKDGVTQLAKENIVRDPDTCAAVGPGNNLLTFKPGTIQFFLISDTTVNYFSMVHHMISEDNPVMRPLILDDATGKPAGLQKWVGNGYLKGPPVPLSMLESAYYPVAAKDAAASLQNMSLLSTAMGIGTFPHLPGNPLLLMGLSPAMRGLGFRFASDKRGTPYPVGIDGVCEGHIPPYMTVDRAVDDHFDLTYGPKGCFTPAVKKGDGVVLTGFSKQPRAIHSAYKDHDDWIKAAQPLAPSPELRQVMKDFAHYVYDKYGRYPTRMDPFLLPFIVQVHHIDPEFYEQYWVKEAVSDEQREHLCAWHAMK